MTAPCRFCGQMVQIKDVPTKEEAVEAATMACGCQEATSYQREKKRRERTLNNVRALFGSEEDNEGPLQILLAAAEGILDGDITKIALTLYDGTKASISQTSQGDINVDRTETTKRRLTG